MKNIRIRKIGDHWVVLWGANASVRLADMKTAFSAAKHVWEVVYGGRSNG